MAHNIHDAQFYTLRTPAWHKLGIVSETEESPHEVAQRLNIPTIVEGSITATLPDGTIKRIDDKKAIFGKSGEGNHTLYSVVSNDYEALYHSDFVDIWHKVTNGAPVETMGLLGQGETLFLSLRLPPFDLSGDAIEPYLFGFNPLSGKESVSARTTAIRVVCQNTMNMAMGRQSAASMTVDHRRNPKAVFTMWLKTVWEGKEANVEAIKDVCESLVEFAVGESTVKLALEHLYPVKFSMPSGANEETQRSFLLHAERQQAHQNDVRELFEGSQTRTLATVGNAWGLYNAIVEYEDFGRPHVQSASKAFGEGARRKEKACSYLLSLAE